MIAAVYMLIRLKHTKSNAVVLAILRRRSLMSYNENLGDESDGLQNIVWRMDLLLLELQECLLGLIQKEHGSLDIKEIEEYRLKIIKGMTNRDLDTHTFHAWQLYDSLSGYLQELRFELDKRAKYGLIPIDGSDWEPASYERPSIGPRIDMEEEETGYA
jgi:hypothetical protein